MTLETGYQVITIHISPNISKSKDLRQRTLVAKDTH